MQLTRRFIAEVLQVTEYEYYKVNTFSSVSGRDLSTTRVKTRTLCRVLRLEDRNALLNMNSLFGISSVVGLRKKPPKVCQLKQHDTSLSAHEGALKTDKINFVDMTNNVIRSPRRFRLNADGRKGVDFTFIPNQNSLRITVRYASYVLHEALGKLLDFNITLVQGANGRNQRLTDDELELLLANN